MFVVADAAVVGRVAGGSAKVGAQSFARLSAAAEPLHGALQE